MKIDVLFGGAYLPDPRVRRITQALASAGHHVEIIAWDRSGHLPREEYDGPVRIRRIGVRSRSGRGWTQALYLLRVLHEVLPILRRDRPDVLHAVDLPMLAGALLLRPFVPHRPAIVYDAFELYAVMESRKYPKRVVRLLGYLERQLPRRATAVITPGESRQRYFEERGISSTVVSNWIDPPISAPRRVNARQQLGVQDAFCVAYIGGIQRSRDLEPLIEHARRTPSTVVLIAGRGDNEEPVRTAVAGLSNVRLLGWVSEPAYLYAAADSLYYAIRTDHPYASFAAPNNLYAAIAMAIPLIYRPQGELAIVGGRSRIGVPFSDQVSLDRAVETLREPRTNRAIRAELKKLRTTYSWAAARDALLDLYERIGTTRSRARANGP